jgi:hypothetical protein
VVWSSCAALRPGGQERASMVMSEFFFLPALLFCLPSCLPRCAPYPTRVRALPATACAASACVRPKTTKHVSQNGGGAAVLYVNKNHFDLIVGVRPWSTLSLSNYVRFVCYILSQGPSHVEVLVPTVKKELLH